MDKNFGRVIDLFSEYDNQKRTDSIFTAIFDTNNDPNNDIKENNVKIQNNYPSWLEMKEIEKYFLKCSFYEDYVMDKGYLGNGFETKYFDYLFNEKRIKNLTESFFSTNNFTDTFEMFEKLSENTAIPIIFLYDLQIFFEWCSKNDDIAINDLSKKNLLDAIEILNKSIAQKNQQISQKKRKHKKDYNYIPVEDLKSLNEYEKSSYAKMVGSLLILLPEIDKKILGI
eukprot:TRINITY_DN812_c0_g1_i4.p1 TRINITY_DN812_c0_g1~~TRINITY_DN812_c0_g1_i4.p1  ORF type:complete len:227 (-),score=60.31 TRINITY_DN812_c0_g1_i4:305-985(-)